MRKKAFSSFLILSSLVTALSFILIENARAKDKSQDILICATSEEYRLKYDRQRLKEKFPNLNIRVDYQPTGILAAKLLAEKNRTKCDIVLEMEYGYLEKISPFLEPLGSGYSDLFVEDVVAAPRKFGHKWTPALRNGGAVLINPEVLKNHNVPWPQSYEDLLRPEYKNLISMPNPKNSGTGYMFVKSLINAWGEEKALSYFDKLSKNILQFTSSGSGPVNALVQGEVGVGLGMTAQGVTAINNGAPLRILFFKEGSPFTLYGSGIVRGKQDKAEVKKVFDFVVNTLNRENVEKFYPEKVYKNFDATIKNYPTKINYSDMKNDSWEEKVRVLEKWEH